MKLANAVKRCFKRKNSGWATEKDIRSLLKTPENGGVVIGGYEGKPLIYGGNNHVVAVGGPRSRKTVGLVFPTLLNYRGSVVVHDVRGDLYRATADHRRAMGQKVIRFAPGEVDSPRFNPLDIVRVGTEHESDDVKSVAATSSSDFNLNELQNGDTPVTLYLVTDGADAKRVTRVHQALLALIIKRGLSATIRYQDGHIVPHYRHKLLLLLDDYARFEDGVQGLSDGLAFMAGYGIQSYVAVQNAAQLECLGSMVTNSHIRVFLSPADMETAEYVSKMLGDVVEDGCRKPLLTPDEVLRLPPGPMYRLNGVVRPISGLACLTLRAGNAPIFGAVVPFWNLGQ